MGISDKDISGPEIDRRTTIQLLGATGLFGMSGYVGDSDEQEGGTSGRTANTQQTPGPNQTGGRLSAGWYESRVAAVNIAESRNINGVALGANVMTALLRLNSDLSVRGDLATDWTVDQDAKTMTFQLREDVTFHNGDSFTANDVKYTIRAFKEERLTRGKGKVSAIKPVDEGGVTVVDDHTVRLEFKTMLAPMIIFMTRLGGVGAIMNKQAREDMGASQYKSKPVGTGPFKVTEHVTGSRITLDKFEDYYQTDDAGNQLPYLDGIDIKIIPQASSVPTAIRAGDVDFVHSVPVDAFKTLSQQNDITVDSVAGANWRGLGMNFRREPFDDPRVREAIARGIDNERWVKRVYFNTALPASGVISPATGWAWRPPEEKPDTQNYDPERARQLLKEAGAENLETSITTTPDFQRHARFVRNSLSQIGVSVEVNILPSAEHSKVVEDNKDFDMIFPGTGGDIDPSQGIYPIYHESGFLRELGYFKSQNYDKVKPLLEEQRRTFDREKRKQLLWEIEDILISEPANVFLSHSKDLAARRPPVKGFTMMPTMRNLDTVWLAE